MNPGIFSKTNDIPYLLINTIALISPLLTTFLLYATFNIIDLSKVTQKI